MMCLFCGKEIAATSSVPTNVLKVFEEHRRGRLGIRTHFSLTFLFLLGDSLEQYIKNLSKEVKSLIVV